MGIETISPNRDFIDLTTLRRNGSRGLENLYSIWRYRGITFDYNWVIVRLTI